jgi:hypothetical protein
MSISTVTATIRRNGNFCSFTMTRNNKKLNLIIQACTLNCYLFNIVASSGCHKEELRHSHDYYIQEIQRKLHNSSNSASHYTFFD